MILKILKHVNVRMLEKSLSGIGISSSSPMPQSGIGIPSGIRAQSGTGGHELVRHCQAMQMEGAWLCTLKINPKSLTGG
jgi:hypothetical protein